jgi:Uncharacterized conserved protein
MRAFELIMQRKKYADTKVNHKIIRYDYTIESQLEYLQSLFWERNSVSFVEVFDVCENKMHAIFTFLAMLELIQLQILGLTIGLGMNNFWIFKHSSNNEVINEEQAQLN